eukprot:XP_001703055.1 type-II NADH dehydrogenase [Chlamydomonas reinhardtii]
MPADKPRLLILGGGPAGVILAQRCCSSFVVTLVDPKEYFEITWATPRGLMDPRVAAAAAINYWDIPDLGRVIQARVTQLTSQSALLSSGDTISFDFAAVCSGSSTSELFKSAAATSRGQRLAEMKGEIRSAKSVLVVGGGPSGVEMAAEIVDAFAGKAVTLVMLGRRVESKPPPDDPRPAAAFMAGGELAGCLDERGAVKVLPSLQVEGHPHMFALGDVNNVPETKLGFLAAKQAELAAASLQALARAKAAGGPAPKLQRWKPNGGTLAVMMVTLGRDDGVMRAGGLVFSGCVPALIKSRGLFVQKYRKLLKVNAPGPAPGAAGAAGASGLGRGAVGVAAVAGAPVGAVQAAAEVAQAVAAGCDGGSGSR